MGGGGGGGGLSSVISTVTNPISAIGGALAGGRGREIGQPLDIIANPINSLVGQAASGAMGEKGEAPTAPGEDPRLAAIRKQQGDLADSFRANRSGIENETFNNVAAPERRRLAEQMKGTKAGFNNRGLLFSGLRQGEEAKNEAASQSNLAGARQSINKGAEEQQKQLDSAAANAELSQYQTQAAMQDNIYQQALSNMQGRSSAISGLMGAGGQVGGAYLAGRNK